MLSFLHPSIHLKKKNKYDEASAWMSELVQNMPKFLGVESVHGSNGFGITSVYWEEKESIEAWKRHGEHKKVKKRGRSIWYEKYFVQIVKVEEDYGKV